MARFRVEDFTLLETSPTSAGALRDKLGEMLVNSTSARVQVESMNQQTGEYRLVLIGTLDTEQSPLDER